jgi:hypothetical protein
MPQSNKSRKSRKSRPDGTYATTVDMKPVMLRAMSLLTIEKRHRHLCDGTLKRYKCRKPSLETTARKMSHLLCNPNFGQGLLDYRHQLQVQRQLNRTTKLREARETKQDLETATKLVIEANEAAFGELVAQKQAALAKVRKDNKAALAKVRKDEKAALAKVRNDKKAALVKVEEGM